MGRLVAKPIRVVPMLIFFGFQAAHAQGTLDTPQQQTNEKIEQLAALGGVHPGDIPIGSGDLLHIDVFDVPELSREVRVSETDDISYPLIPGKIHVGGLTPFQLEAKLEQLLVENGLVSHPHVSVFVKEENSQPITIEGAVGHPMIYQAIGPTTLLEVLTAAGGIATDAGSSIIVSRPVHGDSAQMEPASDKNDPPQDHQLITIPLQDLLESGNPVFNIPLYGGDVVSVPRAGIVYVMGPGVAQPGEYVLQGWGEQVTVLKAVALAHGLTAFAKADSAVIMRTNPATGKKDEIPVHIHKIEKRKIDDVPLLSNDILYIPDSAGKKTLAKGASAILGIGSSVAVYRTTAP